MTVFPFELLIPCYCKFCLFQQIGDPHSRKRTSYSSTTVSTTLSAFPPTGAHIDSPHDITLHPGPPLHVAPTNGYGPDVVAFGSDDPVANGSDHFITIPASSVTSHDVEHITISHEDSPTSSHTETDDGTTHFTLAHHTAHLTAAETHSLMSLHASGLPFGLTTDNEQKSHHNWHTHDPTSSVASHSSNEWRNEANAHMVVHPHHHTTLVHDAGLDVEDANYEDNEYDTYAGTTHNYGMFLTRESKLCLFGSGH